MNLSRRPFTDIIGGLSCPLQDAVSIAVLTTLVVANSVLAASEALEDPLGGVTVVANRAVRPGVALERPQ